MSTSQVYYFKLQESLRNSPPNASLRVKYSALLEQYLGPNDLERLKDLPADSFNANDWRTYADLKQKDFHDQVCEKLKGNFLWVQENTGDFPLFQYFPLALIWINGAEINRMFLDTSPYCQKVFIESYQYPNVYLSEVALEKQLGALKT